MKKIEMKFYMEHIDRYIIFIVDEEKQHESNAIIQKAYNEWLKDDMGYNCEEYLCECMGKAGIDFLHKYEMSDKNKISFLKQLLHEEEYDFNGIGRTEENQARLEALRWAIEVCEDKNKRII